MAKVARANSECRALRESGTREVIFLGYKQAETILYRCQPSGRAVFERRGNEVKDEKKKNRRQSM